MRGDASYYIKFWYESLNVKTEGLKFPDYQSLHMGCVLFCVTAITLWLRVFWLILLQTSIVEWSVLFT